MAKRGHLRRGGGDKSHRAARIDQTKSPAERRPNSVFIYGIHPAIAAFRNPNRKILRILATRNALDRIAAAGANCPLPPEEATPRALDRLLGGEAVHQGIAIEAAPLDPVGIEALGEARLLVVLDQVTDPHNVGAILRSALAFGADAVISTARHAPAETGVLAKAASGALDQLPLVQVQNLARALEALGGYGFLRIGLDSEAEATLESVLSGGKLALVLGAEGRGLRRLTRETCDRLARLPTAGRLASLNVSNAAAVALYAARQRLDRSGE
jgi:23S rRNA (guanosine2251-2'-O)-methyltransferase